jgi:hypothetical protein
MSKYKFVTGLVVLLIFASVSFSTALMSTSRGSSTAPPPAQTKMLKVVGIVAKITDGTLYLKNNKSYNLRNVKVIYNKGKRISENKRTADMFFVNGVLKEVIIYN